jgi:hypothetical protein
MELVENPLPGDAEWVWTLADIFRLDPLLARHIEVMYMPGSEHLGACWIWTGSTAPSRRRTEVYGKLSRTRHGFKRWWYAHRYVWMLLWGNPACDEIHHECSRTRCCNPNHLACSSPQDHSDLHNTYRAMSY